MTMDNDLPVVVDDNPLGTIDHTELFPVPEAASPVCIVNLVGSRGTASSQDLLWVQNSTSELHQILAKLQIPGVHLLHDLWGVTKSVSKLLENSSPLDRILPGELTHVLHQFEVCSLFIRQPCHVAQLWDQVDWTSLPCSLVPQLKQIMNLKQINQHRKENKLFESKK